MAVSCAPDLLIADEPTTALDVTVQAQILRLLLRLRRELGMALLLITHDFGVIAGMVERVHVMLEGAIVESGPIDGIFADPQHAYTRALLDAVPRLDRAGRPA
jgi:ABC-type dipeptide/oligopeptide/nickel transport system ATPase component